MSGTETFKWENLRLRNQVLMILVAESVIVFLVMFAIQYVLLQRIEEIFKTSMKHIMIKEMKNKLNTQMWGNFRSAYYIINRNAFQVLGMNALFNYSQNLFEIEQPADFLLNFEHADQYGFAFTYTYSFFGSEPVPNDRCDSAIKNFSSLATQVLFMQDEFSVYYATIRENAFFAASQAIPLVGYNPQVRPWYVNHLQHLQNKINESPPYITWGFTAYVFTQTTNLTYFDGSLEGIIAAEYNQSQFISNQIDPSIQTIILGQDGIIQMIYDANLIGDYIYNQSVTGYSYMDFMSIIQSLNISINNQCRYAINLLCLYNSSNKAESIIMTKQLPISNVIIMLQLDPSEEFQIIDQKVQGIVQKLLQLSICNIQMHFAARLVTTVVSVVLFFIISRPIYDLIAYTQSFHHDKQSLFSRVKLLMKFNNKRQFDPIFEIKQAYFQLFNNLTSNRKCYTCRRIEYIKDYRYEDKDNEFNKRLSQIKDRLTSFYDNDYQSDLIILEEYDK